MQRFFVYPEWLDSHNPKDKVEVVKCSDHEQALAEKDREIAKWRRIRTPTHGNCCTCQKCGLDHDSCRCDIDDVCDELDQLKKAYQQLMEKAVRFADMIRTERECTYGGYDAAYKASSNHRQAYDFLTSPEVQAWKEVKP